MLLLFDAYYQNEVGIEQLANSNPVLSRKLKAEVDAHAALYEVYCDLDSLHQLWSEKLQSHPLRVIAQIDRGTSSVLSKN